jgi:hypothetical protein
LESVIEILQVFAATVGIVDPDFAFDTRQRVQLRFAPSQPQIGGGCHSAVSFVVLGLPDFCCLPEACARGYILEPLRG